MLSPWYQEHIRWISEVCRSEAKKSLNFSIEMMPSLNKNAWSFVQVIGKIYEMLVAKSLCENSRFLSLVIWCIPRKVAYTSRLLYAKKY